MNAPAPESTSAAADIPETKAPPFEVHHQVNRRALTERWLVRRQIGAEVEWVCNPRGRIKRFRSAAAAQAEADRRNAGL